MILTFSITGIYIKSENIMVTVLVWVTLLGIIILMNTGISLYLFRIPIVFLLGWGIFSLITYFEESIFWRLLFLLFGMFLIFGSITSAFKL
jgi:hypothetical protein